MTKSKIEQIERLADQTARASVYLSGAAAGYRHSAHIFAADDDGEIRHQDNEARPTSTYRRRQDTKRPLLEILRESGRELTVTELMELARAQGHDPIRDTVKKALKSAVEQGVVRHRRGRYRTIGKDR